MPVFYNYTEGGYVYSFDDVFVPADAFRQGTLWTWGYGGYGALGDNTTTNRSTPVTTFAGGTNWSQVAGGQYHTAAIKTDGTLWTWGYNNNGQLGVNDTNSRCTPVTTFAGGTNWKQVAGGQNFTIAITDDGINKILYGFGNALGLGIYDNIDYYPVQVFGGGTNWKQVSGGNGHTAAIKTDGTLWTWGYSINGSLGINSGIISSVITPVTTFAGGTNWKQVSSGVYNAAAVKTDGTLWTWGYNTFGQLGDNTTTQRNTPVTTFSGGTNWKQVGGGFYHKIAVTYIDSYQ